LNLELFEAGVGELELGLCYGDVRGAVDGPGDPGELKLPLELIGALRFLLRRLADV